MANRTSRRPEKDARLIGMLKAGLGIIAACKRAGYAYRNVKDWLDADPELERAIQAALEEGEEERLEKFESRGVEGLLEPVFQKGRVVGHVQKHSDVAAIFAFKARNRRRFDDRLAVEMGGLEVGPSKSSRRFTSSTGRLRSSGRST